MTIAPSKPSAEQKPAAEALRLTDEALILYANISLGNNSPAACRLRGLFDRLHVVIRQIVESKEE